MTKGRLVGLTALLVGASAVAIGLVAYARSSIDLKTPATFVPEANCLGTEQVAGPFTAYCATGDARTLVPFVMAAGVMALGIALIAIGAVALRRSAVPAPAGPVLEA